MHFQSNMSNIHKYFYAIIELSTPNLHIITDTLNFIFSNPKTHTHCCRFNEVGKINYA